MKVGDSVRKSILDWQQHEVEASMLHACNAVDGTAKKAYPSLGNKARFTKLLRESYGILGPMGVPGINLVETRFPIRVTHPTAQGGRPDIADVIYAIHRCTHGHGDELPDGFALLSDAGGPPRQTRILMRPGSVSLSDRVIFGLLAVAVLSPCNVDQRVPDSFFLTFGATVKMVINEWWGRAADFAAVAATDPVPSVALQFPDDSFHRSLSGPTRRCTRPARVAS